MTNNSITEPDQASIKDNFFQRIMLVMNRIIARVQSRKMGPLWISLVVISSIAWTVWNVKNFQTSSLLSNSGIQQQLKLDSEIQQLSARWKNIHSEALDEDLEKAELQIFKNYKALAEWLYQLTTESRMNGLTLEYKLGVEAKAPSQDIISIPIEIEAAAYNNTNIHAIYQQLLNFMKFLISEPWHQELQQAGIENESSNKARLSLVLNVWMWKPESPTTGLEPDSSDPLMDTMAPPMDMP